MTFKTAVWQDPATEQYCARIFPEAPGIDLGAWGLTSDLQPVDVTASTIHGLGHGIEVELNRIFPDFPMKKFEPTWLGRLDRGADVRAELEAKLAAVAA